MDKNSNYDLEEIKSMAKELNSIVENNSENVDWEKKDSTKSKMKMNIKRFLKSHNYPKDIEDAALENILKQAENYEELKYS